ncbi:MAG: sulfite exporter TauE/SafE family protein, partial [Streptomyces sp.]|uniref:sulfite exporter TauE/SafE family protein n=1 Tax=Streptomyces sp. TaxID=1931 RepID=UPI003D6A12D2
PPAAFGRLVRRSTKTASMATPVLVGFATVLVPCGVTLSMALVAITAGSPLAGAAVMGGFVVGTAPLFAILGYLFRRSSRALSGRLGIATGVVVLAIAAWTIGSGLQAGGWATFGSGATPAAQASPAPSKGAGDPVGPVHVDASGKQVITLTVTDFYKPTNFSAKAGLPTRLVLHGENAGGCARGFTIPELGVQKIVKENGDTNVNLGTRKPGPLRFSCSMGMQTGTITFQGGTK